MNPTRPLTNRKESSGEKPDDVISVPFMALARVDAFAADGAGIAGALSGSADLSFSQNRLSLHCSTVADFNRILRSGSRSRLCATSPSAITISLFCLRRRPRRRPPPEAMAAALYAWCSPDL